MAKKVIMRKYNVPSIGGIEIIHAPECANGPYYAVLYSYGVSAEKSGSEDEARVRVGKTITVLLGSEKTSLENQISSIQSVLSDIQSSQTPLVALDNYEIKD